MLDLNIKILFLVWSGSCGIYSSLPVPIEMRFRISHSSLNSEILHGHQLIIHGRREKGQPPALALDTPRYPLLRGEVHFRILNLDKEQGQPLRTPGDLGAEGAFTGITPPLGMQVAFKITIARTTSCPRTVAAFVQLRRQRGHFLLLLLRFLLTKDSELVVC